MRQYMTYQCMVIFSDIRSTEKECVKERYRLYMKTKIPLVTSLGGHLSTIEGLVYSYRVAQEMAPFLYALTS